MHLAEIWRYPVKSMAGERLDEVAVGELGLAGSVRTSCEATSLVG